MTATDLHTPTRLRARRARHGPFAGTWLLLRFMFARDRVHAPAWVLGMTAMLAYFANALGFVFDQDSLESFAAFAKNPVVALVGGPGYGFDHITTARFLVGLYGGYLMIGTALMSILTIARHTRTEEQRGRVELVRAYAVGRHAQLAAAIILATLMHMVLIVLMTLGLQTSAADPGAFFSSLLFTCSLAAVGLVFAGVTAVTVQLSPVSRAGAGVAGAVLATGFALRGFADMSFTQQGPLAWLTWVTPFGWSQQTAPFTLDRWWPLLLSLGAATALIAVAFFLEARRDLAAGLVPTRGGALHAPPWLHSPMALAFRLQRSSLLWWSLALLLGGATFGAFVQPLAQNAAGIPATMRTILGGDRGLIEGYLGFMGIYFALMVTVYAILSVHSLRTEEYRGRAEFLLASAVARTRWVGSWVCVTGLGALWLMFLAGFGTGLGAALSTGDWQLFAPTLLSATVHVAPVWALMGVAAGLYGCAPQLLSLTWVVFVYSAVLSLFGEMMQLGDWVLSTSLFQHIGQYPAEQISWASAGAIVGIAMLLSGMGVCAFRRRNLITM